MRAYALVAFLQPKWAKQACTSGNIGPIAVHNAINNIVPTDILLISEQKYLIIYSLYVQVDFDLKRL